MDKYYTPKLEDIFVGYECEIYSYSVPLWQLSINKEREKEWRLIIVNDSFWDDGFGYSHDLKNVRTKCLTQEQIEAEGFELYHQSIDLWFKFKEHPISHTEIYQHYGYSPKALYLNYGLHDCKLQIKCDFDGERHYDDCAILFAGFCSSINELRKIFKLLKIKK